MGDLLDTVLENYYTANPLSVKGRGMAEKYPGLKKKQRKKQKIRPEPVDTGGRI